MKKYGKITIGGIQSRIFNLILFTVVLLSVAGIIVFLNQSRLLSRSVSESGRKQSEAIAEVTGSVTNEMVTETLTRANRAETVIADEMFDAAADRITFLADYAARLLAHPENYPQQPWSGPDPSRDGEWRMKVILAEGTDASDPEVSARIGLLANMADLMVSMCPSFSAANAYIGLPEGVHISVSDNDSSWFENGAVRKYDPRQRGWYQKAEKEGKLVFTEGEYDANSGAYCVECAMPVYGPDGSLRAVVGADLYLDEMEKVLQETVIEGEYQLLINRDGHAVLAPQEAVFPMAAEERGTDLRESGNPFLAKMVRSAIEGAGQGVETGLLLDETYYMTASPIHTTGWVLVSAYSQQVAGKSADLLLARNEEIGQETLNSFRRASDGYRNSSVILLVLIGLAMLALSFWQGGRIVKPLNTIASKIAEIRGDNLEFKMEDAYRTGDEIEALAQSFASLSRKTLEYVETVKKVTAEKERIGTELALATQIQSSMLPHLFPAFPDRKDFDIVASMNPAKEVGGDFYDYFLIDSDHLCMVMADVSGKGVPAALFMMASKIIIQSVAKLGSTPAEILEKTNDAVCSNNEAEMFVTVWLGILELSTGRLTAANAGHEYPMLKQAGKPFELVKDKHGFVIGGMKGVRYKEYEMTLEPDARLFVYTDGVPEATDAEKELFGTERILAALNEEPEAPPQKILENVRKAVDSFVKEAEQFDDLTMLCLEYRGPAAR